MPTHISGALFRKHKGDCDLFIETGSYLGDGIQSAINAGFDTVWSVELNPRYYAMTCSRFIGDKRVKCFLGSSDKWLPELLKARSEHIMFWIDAHKSAPSEAGLWIEEAMALDVGAIFSCGVHDSVIVIDDVNNSDVIRRITKIVGDRYKGKTFDVVDGESPDGSVSCPSSIAILRV